MMMNESTSKPTLAERLQTVEVELRPDLEISRHVFRSKPSYVVRNPLTFHSHSFSAADYQVLVALDGSESLGEVFKNLVAAGTLTEGTEEEFYSFILSLHQMGFLNLPISDGTALYSRFRKRQISQRQAQITGFLFWRVPLLNPDSFLDRTARYVAPLFSRIAFALWLVLMVACAGILWQRWDSFTEPLHSILVAKNLVGLWVLLIGLKMIHEFGHAYACKLFGGHVPQMGAYFICFTPCAYVDASAAWGFPSKRQRIIVSLGGMYVESIVAAIALIVWNLTGPSVLNSFAHQTVTVASLVTVGFNINPLMRYDGYYILSDLVEIPNLRQRSVDQVQATCKRWLLGIRPDPSDFSPSARALLLVYGLGASLWKVSLVLGICVAVAFKVYILGALMAVIYGTTTVFGLLRKFVAYIFWSPETAPVRLRAAAVGTVVLVGVPVGIATVRVHRTVTIAGVVASENERAVYAHTAGFLRSCDATLGQRVDENSILCALGNIHVQAATARASAELDLLRTQAQTQVEEDPAAAAMTQRRAAHTEKALRQAQQNAKSLLIQTPCAGEIVQCNVDRQMGRFVKAGEPIATIASGAWVVRSLATAEDLADTTPSVGQKVQVRAFGNASESLTGTITEVAASGSRKINSLSLTQLGGGSIPVAPQTMTAMEPFFEIEIALDRPKTDSIRHGMTALVRFDARPETIGTQLYRAVLRFINNLRT